MRSVVVEPITNFYVRSLRNHLHPTPTRIGRNDQEDRITVNKEHQEFWGVPFRNRHSSYEVRLWLTGITAQPSIAVQSSLRFRQMVSFPGSCSYRRSLHLCQKPVVPLSFTFMSTYRKLPTSRDRKDELLVIISIVAGLELCTTLENRQLVVGGCLNLNCQQ